MNGIDEPGPAWRLGATDDRPDDAPPRALSFTRRARPDPMAAVLDSLAAMLFVVVAGDRRVVLMNRAARGFIASGGCLAISQGALRAVSDRDNRRLCAAFAAVGQQRSAREALRLSSDGGAEPLHVGVSLLAADDDGPDALVMVAATQPKASTPDQKTLRSLFGLTVSEAAVLQTLLSGQTLEQCAHARGVAISTARSQLSSILAKTGTCTQTQLVTIAKTLPPVLPNAPH